MKEYCVCCLVCGKLLQKSSLTSATIKCRKCGTMIGICVSKGIVAVVEEDNPDRDNIYNILQM